MVDQHLIIVLLPLAGAFILGIGVAAGSWLRGAATDPAHLQVRATNRELMAWRKDAQQAMGKVIEVQAEVINDRSTSPHTRWKIQEAQSWLAKTTEPTAETGRRSGR